MCLLPLALLAAVQGGEWLRMIQYSPGETQYDAGLLPSFKHLSLSDSLPFPWGLSADWGGDALRQRMMRWFPGETRHDLTVGIPRGPGPGLR